MAEENNAVKTVNQNGLQGSENQFFNVKPIENVDTRTTTTKIMDEVHKQAIVSTVQNDEDVRNKVLKQAEKSIDNELQSIDQENVKRLQETTYDANKEACNNYGINSNVPLWQIALMKGGSAFWFLVYWVFATLVICPLNVFCKGLKAFIKQSWLVILVGVFLYLLITIGVPVLISLFRKYGFDPSQWFNPDVTTEIIESTESITDAITDSTETITEAIESTTEATESTSGDGVVGAVCNLFGLFW